MSHVLADWLLDPAGLTPHGFCLLWEPGLIWTYAISDIGIGLAYFTIPLALAIFARRRSDLAFRPVVWLFAAFILLCGTTHWLDVLTLWIPAYGMEAAVKILTAIVSIVTAVALWRLLPHAVALPSQSQLQAVNAALRESEALHRARFEHSPVPLYTMEGNDVLTGVSDSWLALLGYARQDVIGRPVQDFWATDMRQNPDSDRATLLAEGEVRDLDRHFRRQDGSVVEGLVTSRLEHSGDATWVLSALIDVTERRRTEAALRASEERLHQAQKMEAVGQLTGGIAHDFNNMLQGIAGAIDLIERRIGQGRVGEVGRYIDTARQAADRAARLTSRMLAFARRQALQPTSVEPDKLVHDMEELIRRTVGPEIEIALILRDGVWAARCDANQLESALLNLAINARDAMPDGGRITIATADHALTETDLVDQDGVPAGDFVEITVADTGTGMPPDILARAFEPFFTTKPLGQGTGLGLSQTYGFVQQSGGFLRLESAPAQGTTVRLYLPRYERTSHPPADQPGRTTQEVAAPDTAAGMVLVVEDEPGIREMIVDALRDLGCEVLEAPDGSAGLRIIQSGVALDLLVTDVGLPGMNGRQLADVARVRQPNLPVLLITGYAGRALDDAEMPPWMELIRKPFVVDALVSRVCAMLEASMDRRVHHVADTKSG